MSIQDARRVAVIGAGSAGLAAARALRAEAVPFTVFEARDGLGGTWRYDPGPGASSGYASLTSNTSRRNTSFRALAIPRGSSPFVHHTEMLAYLEAFADRFGLREHIRFGSPVRSVRPDGDGWSVDGERFAAVVVASGYNRDPRPLDVPGRFDGLTLHTRDYRTPDAFAGRDVVVVGLGCSASELACEIADHASSVALAVRSGPDITAKRLGPVPVDWFDTRGGSRVPLRLRRRLQGVIVRAATGDQAAAGLPAPPARTGEKPVTVSDRILPLSRSGRVAVRPPVVELLGDRVRFADGREHAADALLLGTGYRTTFPFLDPACVAPSDDAMPLYRGIASPTRGLHFVGIVSAHGALMPLMEAQAAWAAAVLAGRLVLPGADVMEASVRRDREVRERDFDARYVLMRDRLRYVRALEAEVKTARRRAGAPPRRAAAPTTA